MRDNFRAIKLMMEMGITIKFSEGTTRATNYLEIRKIRKE